MRTGDGAGQRPSAELAFRAARRSFLAGERLDMTTLARQLGVSRVTLYRWVGSRESMLTEVLWSLTAAVLDEEAKRTRARGGRRIVLVITRFLQRIADAPGVQRLLREEGELAIRLLARHDAAFQPRLVAAVHDLIQAETERGRLTLSADSYEVAYVIVRIVESYTYLDLIIGEEPATTRAEPILGMLLR